MRHLVALAITCICLCSACPSPRITLTVQPPDVCPGDSALVSWETDAERAEGRLYPGSPTPRILPPTGSDRIPATEDVSVIVGAWKNGLYSSKAASIHVIREARSFSLNVPVTCSGGMIHRIGGRRTPRPRGTVERHLRSMQGEPRAATVVHGGGSGNLPGGAGTLIGSVVEGTWTIISSLRINERCAEVMGDTRTPAPTSVALEIAATCGGVAAMPVRPPSGPGNINQDCPPGAACYGGGVCQIGTNRCIDPNDRHAPRSLCVATASRRRPRLSCTV